MTVTAIATDGSAAPASTTSTLNVTVNPVVDTASITGNDAGSVIENSSPQILTTSGQLSVSDPDVGESSFVPGATTASSGALGTLTITATGEWTYTVANAAVKYLSQGATKVETFTVRTVDGSTRNITITIIGVDDAIPRLANSGFIHYAPIRSELVAAETGFIPALYVLPAVSDAQEQTSGITDGRLIRSQSIGAGLGMDIALYVLPAVGDVGSDSQAITAAINGAMARSFGPNAGAHLLGADPIAFDLATAEGALPPAASQAQISSLEKPVSVAAPIARKSFAQQLNLAARDRYLGKFSPIARGLAVVPHIDETTDHSTPADRSAA